VGFGADGVVALEVAGDEVVGVDELADGDGLGGKADDLVELTDGLSRGNGADGQFVSCRDVGERGEAQTVERLACGKRLEGDHDVVRASELESLVAQTVLLSPIRRCGNRCDEFIGTTTLYSNCTIKDSGSPSPWEFSRKVFYLMGIRLYLVRQSIRLKVLQSGDLGSERLGRSVGRDSGAPKLSRAGLCSTGQAKGKDKSNSRFLHCGGKVRWPVRLRSGSK
jgi:hypothetical protein